MHKPTNPLRMASGSIYQGQSLGTLWVHVLWLISKYLQFDTVSNLSSFQNYHDNHFINSYGTHEQDCSQG